MKWLTFENEDGKTLIKADSIISVNASIKDGRIRIVTTCGSAYDFIGSFEALKKALIEDDIPVTKEP